MRRIALAVGDPNGIGPEIALKAVEALHGEDRLRITLFGPPDVLVRTAKTVGLEQMLYGVELRAAATISCGVIRASAVATLSCSVTCTMRSPPPTSIRNTLSSGTPHTRASSDG